MSLSETDRKKIQEIRDLCNKLLNEGYFSDNPHLGFFQCANVID